MLEQLTKYSCQSQKYVKNNRANRQTKFTGEITTFFMEVARRLQLNER